MRSFDYESRISDIAYNIQMRYRLNDDYYGDHYPDGIRDFENQLNSLNENSEYADDIFRKINNLFENYAIAMLESDNFYTIFCESSRKELAFNVIIRADDVTDYYIHNLKNNEMTIVDGNRDGLEGLFDFLVENSVDKFKYMTNVVETKNIVQFALDNMIDNHISYRKNGALTKYLVELITTGMVDMNKVDEMINKELYKLSGIKDPSKPKRNIIKDWCIDNPQVKQEILKRVEKFPLYSQENNKLLDAKIAIHIFGGAIDYYITEGEPTEDNKDIEFFGWCNLGNDHTAEFGYVTFNQIKDINSALENQLGFMLEVEKKCPYKTLEEVAKSSSPHGLDKFLELNKGLTKLVNKQNEVDQTQPGRGEVKTPGGRD